MQVNEETKKDTAEAKADIRAGRGGFTQRKKYIESSGYGTYKNNRRKVGYVAYATGLKGVVVGEGDTYGRAMADVRSAIKFHIETFGVAVID
jgi:hypothetical protein